MLATGDGAPHRIRQADARRRARSRESHQETGKKGRIAMIPALANHLWQSTIFACVVTLVTLALRQNQARTRHTLWLAASVKFLVPFSLLIALGSQGQWRTATLAQPTSSFTMEELSQPLAKAPIVASSPAAPVPVNWIPPTLISLWLCGVAAILTRWMLRWRRIT